MRESRMYRDSRAWECFVRKKWLVSGAVWSLSGPQILGRPTTYQGIAKLSSCKQQARLGGSGCTAEILVPDVHSWVGW